MKKKKKKKKFRLRAPIDQAYRGTSLMRNAHPPRTTIGP
jgi:hypothetical protein